MTCFYTRLVIRFHHQRMTDTFRFCALHVQKVRVPSGGLEHSATAGISNNYLYRPLSGDGQRGVSADFALQGMEWDNEGVDDAYYGHDLHGGHNEQQYGHDCGGGSRFTAAAAQSNSLPAWRNGPGGYSAFGSHGYAHPASHASASAGSDGSLTDGAESPFSVLSIGAAAASAAGSRRRRSPSRGDASRSSASSSTSTASSRLLVAVHGPAAGPAPVDHRSPSAGGGQAKRPRTVSGGSGSGAASAVAAAVVTAKAGPATVRPSFAVQLASPGRPTHVSMPTSTSAVALKDGSQWTGDNAAAAVGASSLPQPPPLAALVAGLDVSGRRQAAETTAAAALPSALAQFNASALAANMSNTYPAVLPSAEEESYIRTYFQFNPSHLPVVDQTTFTEGLRHELAVAQSVNAAGSASSSASQLPSSSALTSERIGFRALFFAICTVGAAIQSKKQLALQYFEATKQAAGSAFCRPSQHMVSALLLMNLMHVGIEGDLVAGECVTTLAHVMLSNLRAPTPNVAVAATLTFVGLVTRKSTQTGTAPFLQAGARAVSHHVLAAPLPRSQDTESDPVSRFVNVLCYVAYVTDTIGSTSDLGQAQPLSPAEAQLEALIEELEESSLRHGFFVGFPWTLIRSLTRVMLALKSGRAVEDVPGVCRSFEAMCHDDTSRRAFPLCILAAHIILMLKSLKDRTAASSVSSSTSPSPTPDAPTSGADAAPALEEQPAPPQPAAPEQIKEALTILPYAARFILEAAQSGGCPLPPEMQIMRKLRASVSASTSASSDSAGQQHQQAGVFAASTLDGCSGSCAAGAVGSCGTGGGANADPVSALFLLADAARKGEHADIDSGACAPATVAAPPASSTDPVPASLSATSAASSHQQCLPASDASAAADMVWKGLKESSDPCLKGISAIMTALREAYAMRAAAVAAASTGHAGHDTTPILGAMAPSSQQGPPSTAADADLAPFLAPPRSGHSSASGDGSHAAPGSTHSLLTGNCSDQQDNDGHCCSDTEHASTHDHVSVYDRESTSAASGANAATMADSRRSRSGSDGAASALTLDKAQGHEMALPRGFPPASKSTTTLSLSSASSLLTPALGATALMSKVSAPSMLQAPSGRDRLISASSGLGPSGYAWAASSSSASAPGMQLQMQPSQHLMPGGGMYSGHLASPPDAFSRQASTGSAAGAGGGFASSFVPASPAFSLGGVPTELDSAAAAAGLPQLSFKFLDVAGGMMAVPWPDLDW